MIKELGYEVMYFFRTDQSCTWVEIKRPGNLTSIKAGQSLAKVVYNNGDSLYTIEEQIKIKTIAADLNIQPQLIEELPIRQILELIKQRTNK